MQIHELNNFTGTLGSGAYLAIDDGNDTGKISSQGLLAATEARIDNIIAGPAPSAEEIVDARLGDDGVTYPSLGDAIRDQFSDVKSALSGISNYLGVPFELTIHEGYLTSTEYYAGKSSYDSKETELLPCKAGEVFYFKGYTPTNGVSAIFYDAEKAILDSIRNSSTESYVPITIPSGAYYVKFSSADSKGTIPNLGVYREDSTNNRLNILEADVVSKAYVPKGSTYLTAQEFIDEIAPYNTVYIVANVTLPDNTVITRSNLTIITNETAQLRTTNLKIVGSNNNIKINLRFEGDKGLTIEGNENTIHDSNIWRYTKTTAESVSYYNGAIIIDGAGNIIDRCKLYNANTNVIIDGDHNKVSNCIISDAVTGIIIGALSNYNEITSNLIRDISVISSSGADGILVKDACYKTLINRNAILRVNEHGMYVQSAESIVSDNIIYGCGGSGIKLASYADNEETFKNRYSKLIGNICTFCDNGITIQNTNIGCIITNNTTHDNVSNSIRIVNVIGEDYEESRDIMIVGNYFAEDALLKCAGGLTLANNMFADIQVDCTCYYRPALLQGNFFGDVAIKNTSQYAVFKDNFCGNLNVYGGLWDIVGNNIVSSLTDIDLSYIRKLDSNDIELRDDVGIEASGETPIQSIVGNTIYIPNDVETPSTVISNKSAYPANRIKITDNLIYLNKHDVFAVYLTANKSICSHNIINSSIYGKTTLIRLNGEGNLVDDNVFDVNGI